jgi:hypothetical protein
VGRSVPMIHDNDYCVGTKVVSTTKGDFVDDPACVYVLTGLSGVKRERGVAMETRHRLILLTCTLPILSNPQA